MKILKIVCFNRSDKVKGCVTHLLFINSHFDNAFKYFFGKNNIGEMNKYAISYFHKNQFFIEIQNKFSLLLRI